MRIIFHENKAIGAEETVYPRFHEWSLSDGNEAKITPKCKTRHIYRSYLQSYTERPTSETRWPEELDAKQPASGWPEIWNMFKGLAGTPRDSKTMFKLMLRFILYTRVYDIRPT